MTSSTLARPPSSAGSSSGGKAVARSPDQPWPTPTGPGSRIAEPRTQWLPDEIRRDRWGFVVTGTDLMACGHPPDSWPLQRPPMLLESSLPGVFAVGDVRCGSVKRVASAVGEGSVAIRLIHDYLRDD